MSAGSIHNEGNGRLWERFQLSDINDRLQNLYQHLRDVVHEFGPQTPDYSQTVTEIQSLFNQHQEKVSGVADEWKRSLALRNTENNALRAELNKLREALRNAKRDGILENGIERYIAARTKQMNEELQAIRSEKENAQRLLEQERRKQTEYRQKYEQLMATVDELRKHDASSTNVQNEKYKEYKRKYEDLRAKYELESKRVAVDDGLHAALDTICDRIASTPCFDAEKMRKLWQDDLDQLSKIYEERLNEKEREWQAAKNKSVQALDREYKHLESHINERLQMALDENKELKRLLQEKEKELERCIQDYDVKIANLREAMKAAESDNDRLQAAGGENEELQRELKRREEEFKRRLVEYDMQISNLRESMKAVEADRDRLRRLHDQKAKQLTAKVREITDLQADLSKVRESMKRAEGDKDRLQKQHEHKSRQLASKHKDIMDLQTELSKYKVLWQHFFGLDADLKNEINLAQQRLDKLERRHQIQSPVPRKQRLVPVESIKDWLQQYSIPPLMVDNIPLPNDRYQRFSLFNFTNVAIKFKNFKLVNNHKQSFPIDPSIQVRGHGYITIALKEKKHNTDILAPSDFRFSFQENELLYLDDGKEKIQIFPRPEKVLTHFAQFVGSPLKAVPLEESGNGKVRGFRIHNITNTPIILLRHMFKNERDTFSVPIPSQLMKPCDTFRLITVEGDQQVDTEENDIIVPFDCIRMDVDDKLLVVDESGTEIVLYRWNAAKKSKQSHNHNHNGNGAHNHSCFVM